MYIKKLAGVRYQTISNGK